MARFAFVLLLAIGASLTPVPADGQLVGGVFWARARDSFGGTNGFGAQAGVSIPLIPLEVFAAGTLFKPGCSGCDLKGWSVGAKLGVFAIPVLQPYVTGGRTWRYLDDPGTASSLDDQGFFTGAGLELRLPGFSLFGEGRYEFLTEDPGPDDDLRQWAWRAGLMLRWGGLSP